MVAQEYSHLHHKYWIPAMCVVCFFASSFVISNSIPNVRPIVDGPT
jgi:hypothetical protein